MNDQRFQQSMRRICENDKEGLREIYEDYCPMIYSVVLDILKSREDAEDITSDFFIRLWDIAGSYKAGCGHREVYEQLDLFTDYEALEKRRAEEEEQLKRERKIQEAMLDIKKKFGGNAILKGMNLQDGATARERNGQIGGHKA